MKLINNKNVKKTAILNFAVIFVFCIIFLIVNIKQYNSYKNILNNTINKIINEVLEKYPEISEQEILSILKSDNKRDVLLKYGYDNDTVYIKTIEETMTKNIFVNLIFIIMFGICLYVVYNLYVLKQERKVEQINNYLKEINNKNYILNIEENDEGELSKLRNELYKTTVLLKETAENSEKEKKQLSNALADISHQIKTPLTSITIMLDNIKENPDMDENIKMEFIREISKQTEWIKSLVISLLKLAKFDAGAIKMNNKQINVKELIENAVSNLSILMEIKNIKIITKIDNEVVFLGDYKWQLEAITNIIKNAIEHSNEDSTIYIDVENTSLFLKIKIRDEGDGISEVDLKHLFERFYKSKNSSSNSIGIGLPLARAIIEKNNGYIKVDSKENEGTTFEIKYIK